MSTLLYRLGTTAYRRWPVFVGTWLVLLIAMGGIAGALGKAMSDEFSIPGIPSERAADLQAELFPDAGLNVEAPEVSLVVAAPEGHALDEPGYRQKVDDLLTALAAAPQMPTGQAAERELLNPVDAAAARTRALIEASVAAGAPEAVARANAQALSPLSEDGRVGIITFTFDEETAADVDPATIAAVEEIMADARAGGLVVEANGQGMTSRVGGGATELIGIGVAVVVLVLTFGSLVAAGLPVVTALIGVGFGMLGITASTAFMTVGSTTPMLALMIGLAVGIDYSLFILARYRAELQHTDDRAEAAGVAVGTAGSAVVFAGLTVLIALAALSVVRIPFLTSMGVAAALTVLVAVLVALTLLPAFLGLLRGKTFGLPVRKHLPRLGEDGKTVNNGVRWARLVGRSPIVAAVLVVGTLGALAIPAAGMSLALPSDSTAPSSTTQRKAADLIGEAFGAGTQARMLIVVDGRGIADPAARPAAYGQVVAWAAGQRDVANAQIVAMNEDGSGAQIMLTPRSSADDPATSALLTALRDGQEQIERRTGTAIGVTGLTAIAADVSDRLGAALPIYLAVVIGLAFVLLVLVFRSILVPLTATLGFLLSVLATLGATVAVFQEGAFGLFEGQPLISFMPVFLIGLVFGLAMDYQVFLVTRIREAHVHGAPAAESVVDGFRNSARVVAAAAVIMISVFGAFMLQDEPIIASMGFALAGAVFFDAFLVRMTLIPALMFLMKEKAWWIPARLDRLLPDVDVEGEALLRHRQENALMIAASEPETAVRPHLSTHSSRS